MVQPSTLDLPFAAWNPQQWEVIVKIVGAMYNLEPGAVEFFA